MKKSLRVALLSLIAIAIVLLTAQNSGNTGIQTYTTQVFNAVSVPTTSAVLRNIGQSAHYLIYCGTGVTGIRIWIEGSFDAVTWVVISQQGISLPTAGGCGQIQAGGYYSNVRINLNVITGGTVSAWYSASDGPIPFQQTGNTSLGPAPAPQCDTPQVSFVADNTTAVLVTGTLPIKNIYVCNFAVDWGGAPTKTSTVTFFDSSSVTCSPVTDTLYVLRGQTSGAGIFQGSGLGALFQTLAAGNTLCVTTASVGFTTTISFNYARY